MNECTVIFGDGCCVALHGDDYDINFDEMETAERIAFIQKNMNQIRGKATAGSDLEEPLTE